MSLSARDPGPVRSDPATNPDLLGLLAEKQTRDKQGPTGAQPAETDERSPRDRSIDDARERAVANGPPAPVEADVDLEVPGDAFEAARSGSSPESYASRDGYLPQFHGRGTLEVPLPGLSRKLTDCAAEPLNGSKRPGTERFALAYTHFSVVMNAERRMPVFSAVNIHGKSLRRLRRRSDRWQFDPRIDRTAQSGDDIYRNNDLDRGHMTRRLDPVWGPSAVAALADQDTFHFTNACPQHKHLNQREWSALEDYVLGNAGVHDLKVNVFTGPVFCDADKPYRGILIPEEYWKVVVIVRIETGQLSATGYILSQKDMLTGFEFVFGQFRVYQVTIHEVERKTGLDFGRLAHCDPLLRARPEAIDGFESVTGTGVAKVIGGPNDLVL